MRALDELFQNNKKWAEKIRSRSPDFFKRLSKQQRPKHFWIGCSDSRVPAEGITGLPPGELFVHRNIANLVAGSDLNVQSAIQFAVDGLGVENIIVCGHSGCGGVKAALQGCQLDNVDLWLDPVKQVATKHERFLSGLPGDDERVAKLCELNVIEQVLHTCETSVVQEAWARGQNLAVHGWIYGMEDGLLRDLKACMTAADEVDPMYRDAVAACFATRSIAEP